MLKAIQSNTGREDDKEPRLSSINGKNKLDMLSNNALEIKAKEKY
jgi:hypothetical protein